MQANEYKLYIVEHLSKRSFNPYDFRACGCPKITNNWSDNPLSYGIPFPPFTLSLCTMQLSSCCSECECEYYSSTWHKRTQALTPQSHSAHTPHTLHTHTKLNWKIIIAIFHVGWSVAWLTTSLRAAFVCRAQMLLINFSHIRCRVLARTGFQGMGRDGTIPDWTGLLGLAGLR